MGDLITEQQRESLAKASKILFQLAKVQSFIKQQISLPFNGVEFDIASLPCQNSGQIYLYRLYKRYLNK
jgi:hypothetical protein